MKKLLLVIGVLISLTSFGQKISDSLNDTRTLRTTIKSPIWIDNVYVVSGGDIDTIYFNNEYIYFNNEDIYFNQITLTSQLFNNTEYEKDIVLFAIDDRKRRELSIRYNQLDQRSPYRR